MSRDELHKLLGGYATGILTAEEREALFAAALEDQELFNALANEQPLRELFEDPATRARLLATLDERRAPWYRAWWIPATALAAMAGLAIVGFVVSRGRPEVRPIAVAELKRAAPVPGAPSAPAMANPPAAPKAKAVRPRRAAPPKARQTEPSQTAVAELHAPVAPLAAPAPKAEADSAPGAQAGGVGGFPRRGFRAAVVAGKAQAGVPYTILRKQPDGTFTIVTADELKKGDQLELRFELDQAGTLTVMDLDDEASPRLLATGTVPQAGPWTTPVLPRDVSRLRITFAGQNQNAAPPEVWMITLAYR
jgi:hypothetical protein